MGSEDGNSELISEADNGKHVEKILKLKNSDIWRTDKGLFNSCSTMREYFPTLNIEIEIITLKELDTSIYENISHEELNAYDKETIQLLLKEKADTDNSRKYTKEFPFHNKSELFMIDDDVGYRCGICDVKFKIKHRLKRHLLTHTNDRPFVCDECHKTFKRKDKLDDHMVIHQNMRDNKSFSCHICGHTFLLEYRLKRHSLIHTNRKPHICELCNKTFMKKYRMERHKLKCHHQKITVKDELCLQSASVEADSVGEPDNTG